MWEANVNQIICKMMSSVYLDLDNKLGSRYASECTRHSETNMKSSAE